MKSNSSPNPSLDGPPVDAFPDGLAGRTSVLLCSFDPTEYAIGLHCLVQFGGGDDSAVVVTTKRGVEDTLDTFSLIAESSDQPSLGIVDMVSEGQSISATYGEDPTVFTPSEGDTERLVLALSELTGQNDSTGDRHLLVRTLSPMLATANPDRVAEVLNRIDEFRTTEGVALFGLDYTQHDKSTVRTIAQTAERVLWIDKRADDTFAMDFQPTRTGHVSFPSLDDE